MLEVIDTYQMFEELGFIEEDMVYNFVYTFKNGYNSLEPQIIISETEIVFENLDILRPELLKAIYYRCKEIGWDIDDHKFEDYDENTDYNEEYSALEVFNEAGFISTDTGFILDPCYYYPTTRIDFSDGNVTLTNLNTITKTLLHAIILQCEELDLFY